MESTAEMRGVGRRVRGGCKLGFVCAPVTQVCSLFACCFSLLLFCEPLKSGSRSSNSNVAGDESCSNPVIVSVSQRHEQAELHHTRGLRSCMWCSSARSAEYPCPESGVLVPSSAPPSIVPNPVKEYKPTNKVSMYLIRSDTHFVRVRHVCAVC